jgi:nucleoside-diphosphate-sugar epimerase
MMSDTRGEVVNIGNPEEYTVADLALKIKDLTRSKSEIIYQDLPTDDPSRRCPDITKASRLLQWQPKIMLDEGLQLTIEYYKSLKYMQ